MQVEPDTEVQGRIHLEIKHYEFIPDTDNDEYSSTPKISIRYVLNVFEVSIILKPGLSQCFQ